MKIKPDYDYYRRHDNDGTAEVVVLMFMLVVILGLYGFIHG
jgi:hypothetical protein